MELQAQELENVVVSPMDVAVCCELQKVHTMDWSQHQEADVDLNPVHCWSETQLKGCLGVVLSY